jgi:hypothetical protein
MVHPRIWPSTHHVFGSISTSQDVSAAWLQPLVIQTKLSLDQTVRSVGTPGGNWVSIGTASATTTKPSRIFVEDAAVSTSKRVQNEASGRFYLVSL